MVGINTDRMSSEAAPFGGMKQSGIGREGSRHGLEDYLEMKYLHGWDLIHRLECSAKRDAVFSPA
nr:aldehyde dehydrogenase family protein [Mesorhizobium metallidurans]